MMIAPDHTCWWISHRTTELSWRDDAILGAGICQAALCHASQSLGSVLAATDSAHDEYDRDLSLGASRGSLHDGCMFVFADPTPELVGALVQGMLEHHAYYLRTDYIPMEIRDHLMRSLRVGNTVRVTTELRPFSVVVRTYASDASWLARLFATRERFAVQRPAV